jgi:hypothetical protein
MVPVSSASMRRYFFAVASDTGSTDASTRRVILALGG